MKTTTTHATFRFAAPSNDCLGYAPSKGDVVRLAAPIMCGRSVAYAAGTMMRVLDVFGRDGEEVGSVEMAARICPDCRADDADAWSYATIVVSGTVSVDAQAVCA